VISVLDHPNIIQFYGVVLTPSYRIITGHSAQTLHKDYYCIKCCSACVL